MIVKQTENSIHEKLNTAGNIYRATIYTGKPYYRDDPKNAKEPWKQSDPTSKILNGGVTVYDRLPIEVQVFTDERIGYQIRDKKTGSIKRVTLLKVGDVDVSGVDLGKADVGNVYKFTPEFQITEMGVRLWKNVKKHGPRSFEWLVEDDQKGGPKFREEPEAFDEESGHPTKVETTKVRRNSTSFVFREDIGQALDVGGKGLRVDTDFYASDNYTVYGHDLVYATAKSTSAGSYQAFSFPTYYMTVGRYFRATNYYTIYRSFLTFDISSVSSFVISSATLDLTAQYKSVTADFDIEIIKQDWSAQNPIDSGNREAAYDNCLSSTKDVAWRNTGSVSLNTRYSSPSLTVSWINGEAAAYYSLRSQRDYDSSALSGKEYVDFYPADAAVGYRPLLDLTYTHYGNTIIF